MGDIDVLTFAEEPKQVSAGRRIAAMAYIQKMLVQTSVLAMRFQKALLEDEQADPKLRFQASEAVLDRFMGKAAQELRIGETEDRPIVFDARLKVLRAGMEAAVDAAVHDGDVQGAAMEAVTGHLVDQEGVSL